MKSLVEFIIENMESFQDYINESNLTVYDGVDYWKTYNKKFYNEYEKLGYQYYSYKFSTPTLENLKEAKYAKDFKEHPSFGVIGNIHKGIYLEKTASDEWDSKNGKIMRSSEIKDLIDKGEDFYFWLRF